MSVGIEGPAENILLCGAKAVAIVGGGFEGQYRW